LNTVSDNWRLIRGFSSEFIDSSPATFTCPPDKSITHRAVMFAAMAKGKSRIFNPLLGEDCRSTIEIFKMLGVEIEIQEGEAEVVLEIDSPGWDGLTSPSERLDFGNSGTTARLLIGMFAATPGLEVDLIGDKSLSSRPMARVAEPLRQMGANIVGHDGDDYLPIHVSGTKLNIFDHKVDKASAQVKSSLIFAGLNCNGTTSVDLPEGSRDHTEKFLRRLGAGIECLKQNGREKITVSGPFRPEASNLKVPGDPSSAAFVAVLAALSPGESPWRINSVLNNVTRCGFIPVMARAQVRMEITSEENDEYIEPVQSLVIYPGANLKGFEIFPEEVPTLVDEIPILAVLAAFADGESRFYGLGELRVKESDRLQKTEELLKMAGAKVYINGDDLIIAGGLKECAGFRYDPAMDHRLAMSAAVFASRSSSDLVFVKDPDCVKVSFPNFFKFYESVVG